MKWDAKKAKKVNAESKMRIDSNLRIYLISTAIATFAFLLANYFSSFATVADVAIVKTQVSLQNDILKEMKLDIKDIKNLLMGIQEERAVK